MLKEKVVSFEAIKTPVGTWILNVNRAWVKTGTTSGTTAYDAKDVEELAAMIRGLEGVLV